MSRHIRSCTYITCVLQLPYVNMVISNSETALRIFFFLRKDSNTVADALTVLIVNRVMGVYTCWGSVNRYFSAQVIRKNVRLTLGTCFQLLLPSWQHQTALETQSYEKQHYQGKINSSLERLKRSILALKLQEGKNQIKVEKTKKILLQQRKALLKKEN